MSNLDSISEHLQLIEPHISEAYIIDNEAVLGNNAEPLQVSTQVKTLLRVNRFNGTYVKENVTEISIKLRNPHTFVALKAQFDTKELLSSSLSDITSHRCWL